MRVLYIAPFAGHSGYSEAAISNILSLDAAGVEVACRHLNTIPRTRKLSERLVELENNRFKNYDFCIQHVPPYMFSYDGRVGKNIGIFYIETEPLPPIWRRYCELMDIILVPSEYEQNLLSKSLDIPIELCHIAQDPERYKKQYQSDKISSLTDGMFSFYTIGELVARKNLAGLIRAFYCEFDYSEPVNLIIKTGLVGVNKDVTIAKVNHIINTTKENLRIYHPKFQLRKEKIIVDSLKEHDLFALHQACDCFVQPSRAESWSIPAFDAMGFGKTPIVSSCGGYLEYLDNNVGWMIPTRKELISGDWSVHPELYNSRQSWNAPDLIELRKSMRQAYSDENLRKRKSEAGVLRVDDFSFEKIGRKLKTTLEKYV